MHGYKCRRLATCLLSAFVLTVAKMMKLISNPESLKELDLRGAGVTDKGFEHLVGLVGIENRRHLT